MTRMLLVIVVLAGVGGWIGYEWNSAADNALLEAAGVGDIQRAGAALKAGANVNATDFDMGATPLIFAAKHNDLPMAMLLIKAGAKLDSTDGGGSALLYACVAHADDVGRYLHGAGATVQGSTAALADLHKENHLPPYCR